MNDDMKHTETEMVDGKPLLGIWALFNMIGGVSGLLSLLVVAMTWGELRKQVEINTEDIKSLTTSGSPPFQKFITGLAAETEGRKDADSSINRRVDDMRLDYGQRIQNITMLLEKQVEQQTALMSLIRAQYQLNRP